MIIKKIKKSNNNTNNYYKNNNNNKNNEIKLGFKTNKNNSKNQNYRKSNKVSCPLQDNCLVKNFVSKIRVQCSIISYKMIKLKIKLTLVRHEVTLKIGILDISVLLSM